MSCAGLKGKALSNCLKKENMKRIIKRDSTRISNSEKAERSRIAKKITKSELQSMPMSTADQKVISKKRKNQSKGLSSFNKNK